MPRPSLSDAPHHVCPQNEVILDPVIWRAHLPKTVVAFFYVADAKRLVRNAVRAARDRFCRLYAIDAARAPLLQFEPNLDTKRPFTLVDGVPATAPELY